MNTTEFHRVLWVKIERELSSLISTILLCFLALLILYTIGLSDTKYIEERYIILRNDIFILSILFLIVWTIGIFSELVTLNFFISFILKIEGSIATEKEREKLQPIFINAFETNFSATIPRLFFCSFWYVICGMFFVIILLNIFDNYFLPLHFLPYEPSPNIPVDPYLFGVFILHITVCIIFILVGLYYRQKYKKMLLQHKEKVENHD